MKIAITGTIASGKSEACKYLENKGFFVFYADEYNNYLLHNNEDVKNKIAKLFPFAIINNDINNKILADIVFGDPDSLVLLENILHPLILEKINEESKKHELLICEIPLLFEKSWEKYFDHNLLIVSSKSLITTRLKNKGYSVDMINKRIANQMPIDDKINKAEEIIYNNGSLSSLYKSIDEFILKYAR